MRSGVTTIFERHVIILTGDITPKGLRVATATHKPFQEQPAICEPVQARAQLMSANVVGYIC